MNLSKLNTRDLFCEWHCFYTVAHGKAKAKGLCGVARVFAYNLAR